MENKKKKASFKSEFRQLESSLQTRIRRTFYIAGGWTAFILLSAAGFVLAKPYLNKKRIERMKQPGYKPRVTLKENPPYNLYGENKE